MRRRHSTIASWSLPLLAAHVLLANTFGADLASRITGTDGAEMTLVPGGEFVMGSLDGDADESPVRRVFLKDFYVDVFEVTHEQYARFLAASGRKPPIDWSDGKMPPPLARHPVVNVTFADAEAYARWAGKRLPTEAEWEKAARGTEGRVYPWGDAATGHRTATPVGDNSRDHTWPVGSFPDDRSPWGVLDMAGNVWEWTDSWYQPYPGNDAVEIEFGHKYRVIRGGGAIDYYGAASTRRCADRARSLPFGRYDALGFRCVQDLAARAPTVPVP
jgi:formylglycine-generating enzyme required for sulfatase activity